MKTVQELLLEIRDRNIRTRDGIYFYDNSCYAYRGHHDVGVSHYSTDSYISFLRMNQADLKTADELKY